MSVKNRGARLERLINLTNEAYRRKRVAVVSKNPTPWKVQYNRQRNRVINAWPEQKGTVDYIGVAQGRAVCFEAKSTYNRTRFPLDLIQEHQVAYLRDCRQQGAITFIIVLFEKLDEVYYLPFADLEKYLQAADEGGRKSIPIQDFREKFPRIGTKKEYLLHYLETALGGV